MRTDWYKGVDPNLERLTELLSMSRPSHGYTIAESAPEIVTAPGVYFPARKGEVIPLESRQAGGNVNPSMDPTANSMMGNTEDGKMKILQSALKSIDKIVATVSPKPMQLESRQGGGGVTPLLDRIGENPNVFTETSSVGAPNPEGDIQAGRGLDALSNAMRESNLAILQPSQLNVSTGGTFTTSPISPIPNLPSAPTSRSYEIQPEAMKLGGSDLIGQEQNEKMKKRIPLFSAQGGAVTVPPEDDEYTKMRRLLGLGEPTPVELGQPEPEGDRLARERLGTTIDLTPVTKEGRTLYEDIGRAKTEQAEYDRYLADKELREAAGITPRTGMPEYEATAARMRMTPGEKYVEDVSKGKLAEQYITNKGLLDVAELKPVSPINVGGRGVYIPGYGFRSAPWGDKITTKSPGAPHPRTTGGYTLISDPTTGLTLATGPTGQSEPYNPKVHGEQELPGVITDDDAKMYANMMANREMIPSQLRLVVQPFGQAGGLSKNKIFKALKQIDPKYNLKVAEAEYAADTKALTSLSTIYATAQTAMGAAENHGKQILGLSQKVDRTGSPAINRYWVAGKKQIAGDEDVNNLDIALHAFDREFSRYLTSMTAGGVIPQREAEAMRALINSANTPEMLIGAVQTVQKLMEGKKESFSDQFNRIKASLGGQTTPSPKGKSMKLSDGTEITVED